MLRLCIKIPLPEERSAVVNWPVDWDTHLADRGSLRSQRLAPIRAKPDDDGSPFTGGVLPLVLHARFQAQYFVFESAASFGVVAEPVKTGAGRC